MRIAGNIASETGAGHRRYSFGQFILDVDRGSLLWEGKDVPLRPKCFEVLRYLVKHPGVLITKGDLLSAVWGDVVVTEDSLTQCLIQIRKALGDSSKVIVRTVPRRGVREPMKWAILQISPVLRPHQWVITRQPMRHS